MSLDGGWSFRLVANPDAIDDDCITGPTDDCSAVEVPGSWALQGHGAPVYLNIRMPFALHAPDVPADNPTAVYRRTFRVAGSLARPPDLRADRFGGFDGVGVGQRRVRRNGQGQPVGLDVRDHRRDRAHGRQRDRHRRAPVERRELDRGPGPVVAARAPPLASSCVSEPRGAPRRLRPRSRPRRRRHDRPAGDRRPRRRRRSTGRPLTVGRGGAGRPPNRADRTAAGARRIRSIAPNGKRSSGYVWPGPRVRPSLEVPGIEPWTHETPTRYRATVTLRDGDTVIDAAVGAAWASGASR